MHVFDWAKLQSDEFDGEIIPIELTDRMQHIAIGLFVDLAINKAVYFKDYEDNEIAIQDFIDDCISRLFKVASVSYRVGTCIIDFAVSFDDDGGKWMICNGNSLLRADYPDLFTAIGTQYGAADGTHFNIPDTRYRALIGEGRLDGDGGNPLISIGNEIGEITHDLTIAEIPSHNHYPYSERSFANFAQPGVVGGIGFSGVGGSSTVVTSNTGGGDSHNNMQPSIGARYIIRVLP
jgi:microcystin-dependent protein